MSLTIPAHIDAAIQGDCALYVQVVISTRDTGGARTLTMTNLPGCGATDQGPAPAIISALRPASYELDPVTRDTSVGQMSIEIADPGTGSWWRTARSACYLKGSRVTLYLGVVGNDVTLANMLPYWSGLVDTCLPGQGYQTISASGSLLQTRNRQLAGLWAWRHPAELAHEILNWCGIPDASIDTDSFAYDVNAAIAHYNVRRVEVAWDGGELYDVTPTGAIDDARVRNWRLVGVSRANSNGGRIYPEVIVTWIGAALELLQVNIYADPDGYRLCATGKTSMRSADGVAGGTTGWKTVTIGPPDVAEEEDRGNSPNPQLGISGSVEISLPNTASYTIAQASTSYLSGDAAMYGEEIDALSAIRDLARSANCAVIEQEDKIAWHYFDPDDSAVAHWGEHELGDTLEVVDIDGNMVNEVRITTGFSKPGSIETARVDRTYSARRASSQTNYSVDGATSNVIVLEWTRMFGNAVSALVGSINDSATTIEIGQHPGAEKIIRNFGVTGAAGDAAGSRAIHADRPAYFELEPSNNGRVLITWGGANSEAEIIKAGASTKTATGVSVEIYDPQTEFDVTRYHNFDLELTGCTRAQFGSTAQSWVLGSLAYDITQPVATAEALLERFEHGAPVVRCTTSLKQLAVQVGELVTIDTELVSAIGLDGVTSAKKWEVCGKEIDPAGDSPGISWLLVMASSPLATTSTTNQLKRPGRSAAGVLADYLAGGRSNVSPVVIAESIEASGAADWIASGAIKDNAITSIKLNDGAVIEDKLGPLAVTAGKLGTGAVTETKIGSEAVTSAKLGASAVSPFSIARDTPVSSRVPNADFGAATKAIATTPPDAWVQSHGTWGTDIKTTSTRLGGVRGIEYAATAEWRTMIRTDYIPVEEGRTYSLKITGQGDSANAGDKVTYRFSWRDGDKVFLSGDAKDHQFTASAWETPEALVITAPTNARYVWLQIYKYTT